MKLVLGAAQLGMAYGAANQTGQPSQDQAEQIVQALVAGGVTAADTARAYGSSEECLGLALSRLGLAGFRVITKVSPLSHLSDSTSPAEAADAVEADVRTSLAKLGRSRLDACLLHRWEHRSRWGGAAWSRLLGLRQEGLISRLGASVSHPAEAAEALADPEVAHVQLPFNLLDDRWERAGIPAQAAARKDVVVHVRSALLQGLIAAPAARWPRGEGWDPDDLTIQIASLAVKEGRSPASLALAYVRSQPWVHGVVVGMETIGQAEENLKLFAEPSLSPEDCRLVRQAFEGLPEGLLNPALWNR